MTLHEIVSLEMSMEIASIEAAEMQVDPGVFTPVFGQEFHELSQSKYKAFLHVEIVFIQRFLFIHARFVFIVQGSLLVVQ